jgi:CheY-like chemotaxis protein
MGGRKRETEMDNMLVVVLDDREINAAKSAFQTLAGEMENTAVGGNTYPGPLLDDDPDLFSSQTDELSQFGCDCRVATCLPEAAALLGERHFDMVLFDLDVFDGKTHRFISQLDDSSASLFSRLDVEGVCWWLPTGITRKGHWETQTLWTNNSHLFFKELFTQLEAGSKAVCQ